MYVTRPLSLYKKYPENLSLPPPEGPNSGYLVVFDEESESTSCFGLWKNKCSIKRMPFPQNKDLTVWFIEGTGDGFVIYCDSVLFIPVLNQPLSSNRYYVVRRKGKRKGEACASSKEEDKGTLCCCSCIRDVKSRPLDPSDTYQQFQIIHKKRWGFSAKSIAPDGLPPHFLRRKYWGVKMKTPRHYRFDEALGLNSSLRAQLPGPNFPLSYGSSGPIVVGKWYCPFMFLKENHMKPNDQMKISPFYETTLEHRWDKIFGYDNVGSDRKAVNVDVVVDREEVFDGGRRAVWDERQLEDGVIWYKICDGQEEEQARVGLNLVIVDRMKWEQEREGCKVGGDEKRVRIERREEFDDGARGWTRFGCYVLVERFVLKRLIDGNIVLSYDFKHAHQIICKWE